MKSWRLFWVLALAAAGPLEGQATGQITGIVKNSDGQPTASATVMLRGTKLSTVTGTDGRYTLPEVPPGSYTLVAALIGYGFATATANVEAGQVVQLDFALEARAVQLEGVTVVGYGTQEKRTVTGAIGTMTADQLVETVTSNPIKAMQNRLAGVDITNGATSPVTRPASGFVACGPSPRATTRSSWWTACRSPAGSMTSTRITSSPSTC